MARFRIQTRRTISMTPESYEVIKRAAAARGVPMSAIIDAALGDFTGPEVEASVARAAAAVRPKPGRQRKPKPVVVPKPPRYVAVAPPRAIRRYPSRERQMLGDGAANALGFR